MAFGSLRKQLSCLRLAAGRVVRSFGMEGLEARRMLAGGPFISEFLASNDNGLKDEDGQSSDWIEIANPGISPVNLAGYYLTHDAGDPREWRLPSVSVPGGGFLVVFASGKDRAVAGGQLHTDFVLNATGDYLALVAPDGQTVLSEFRPEYPGQLTDVSYGIATDVQTTPLVNANVPARTWIPTDASLGDGWKAVGYNDGGWISGNTGVGFDVGTAPPQQPGFTVRMVNVAGAINDIIAAQQIVNGPLPGGFVLQQDVRKDYLVVNHGPGGNYGSDQLLPNNSTEEEEYVLRATANVFIPAGTWSIAVGSDDGFRLKIPGVLFTQRVGENQAAGGGADTLTYSAPRGHGVTLGVFTVPAGGLSTTLTLDFYENNGGDDVELSVASGSVITHNTANYRLLSDGAFPGWSVKTTSSTPPPSYTSLLGTNVQAPMLNHNASAYVRIPLREVLNPNDFDSLRLRMKYDDGFVAYLNGVEIARRNAPDDLSWNSTATAGHADAAALVYEDINVALPAGLLNAGVGTNVLAIHGLNEAVGEGDFLILPELLGVKTIANAQRYFQTPTPGAANNASGISQVVADTKFSHDRGFYGASFQLTISTQTVGATIRYTTDGTAPTATSGTIYTGPITISGTSTIRAAAFKAGAISSNVDSQTYLFTGDIIRQSGNGLAPAGWPANWSPNTTDYGMDPDVVNNPAWSGTIENDLKSLKSLSIVMNLSDLFGTNGIYSNPGNDGRTWERQMSLELIDPNGEEEFQVNGGIRIRGGFSRSTGNPKHAFRFFFRDEYGDGRLDFPIFGETGADSYKAFDLRTFQNYSWSFQGDSGGTFMRDVISRDLQLLMGQPGERGDYYHLYINGQYWGIYNTAERPEADYAATHFGGSDEEYDVIKPAPDNGYSVFATDGDMTAWTQLWNGLRGDMTSNANYLRLQGLNPDRTRNPAFPVLLDVDNLIDYMLVIFYGGNLDAPLSNFLGNSSPNNFFSLRKRNGEEGFKHFVHDAEHTFLNVNEDRTGPFNTISTDPNTALGKSNPQYMFQLLSVNTEFRSRVADRVHKWFFNDGVLTPAKVLEQFNIRRSQLDRAVVAESARWGDAQRATPITRNDWVNAVNGVANNYIPSRTGIVLNQLRADGLYPTRNAPVFSKFGGVIPSNFNLTISNPNGAGVIYYTLDGSDPRLFGGVVSATAVTYAGAIPLSGTASVKARVFDNGFWSALTEATFHHDLSSLRVSEIMFNPAEPAAGSPYTGQDFEFVELVNTGTTGIDLGGVRFAEGIEFEFAGHPNLAAGARTVLVRNAAAFASRYPGVAIGGVFGGTLNDNGEVLELAGPGGKFLSFEYEDGWYGITDGEGYSLVAINPSAAEGSLSEKRLWRPSNSVNGGPGVADAGVNPETVVINEVLTNSIGGDWIELHNRSNEPVNIGGWFLSDDPSNLTKFRIPDGTVIDRLGYLVFTQADHFGNADAEGVNVPFAVSGFGDEVQLSNNEGAGAGGYREKVDFGAATNEVTFGRHEKSTGGADFTAMSAPTMGGPNALPLVGPAVITEIMYNPAGAGDEYIEIHNLTGAPLDVGGWKFVEGVEYTFGPGALLPGFSYSVVVGIAPSAFRAKYGIPAEVMVFGPYVGLIADGGENVKLARQGEIDPGTSAPALVSVDQVNFTDSAPWVAAADGGGPSMARAEVTRYGNDAGNWVAGPPGGTPGMAFLAPGAPLIVSGLAQSGTQIRLNWMDRAGNEDGYRIERSQDGISFAQVGNVAANVTSFDDSGLNSGTFYTYRVRGYNNVGNSIYSNQFSVSTPLSQTINLITITDIWRYNESRTNLGTAWIATNYDDSLTPWKSGGGLLYNESAGLPAPKTTLLDTGPANDKTPTYYLRKHFSMPIDPATITELRLRTVMDDGAALYLNGNLTPIFRLGADNLGYASFATRRVTDAVYEGPFTLGLGGFVQGDNVLAVELKNETAANGDIVFGAELVAIVVTPSVTAQISGPGGGGSPDSLTITFNEPVSGFDITDLRLTRNGGNNLLSGNQGLSSSDGGRTWVLSNLGALTFVEGDYILSLTANGSAVKGASTNRFLGGDAISPFHVDRTAIAGSAGSDTWVLKANGGNLEIFTTVTPGALPAYSAPFADIEDITIDGSGGDDVVELATVLPITPAFAGGAGRDRLHVLSGVHSLVSDLLAASVEDLFVVNAVVGLEASQRLTSLTVGGTGRVNLAANGARFIRTDGLAIAGNGLVDLADNELIVRGGGAGALASVVTAIRSGRGDGTWNGVKGLTSTTARDDARRIHGVAAVLNKDANGNARFETFAGQSVGVNDLLVSFALNGDVNFNGRIDLDDYFKVDAGFLTQPANPSYADGDLDLNGVLDLDDALAIDRGYLGQNGGGTQGAGQAGATGKAVPGAQTLQAPLMLKEAQASSAETGFSDVLIEDEGAVWAWGIV